MKNFVISIPIDENVQSLIRQIGLRLYALNENISEALLANNPDLLFDAFAAIGDPVSEVEYGFGLEITSDQPVAGQRVSERIEIPQLEVIG